MMRPTRIDARGRSRNGTAVLAYLQETEFQLKTTAPLAPTGYYAGQAPGTAVRQTSRWLGRGAAMLGLDGAVDAHAMDRLAHGFDPVTGDALTQTAGREAQWVPTLDALGQPVLNRHGLPKGTWRGGHRVGFDCTFSIAPKSVSLAFAAGTPEERVAILDAMRDAVAQTFIVMEQAVEAGRGHGGATKIGVQGLVASGFTHVSSRELEPQLHEHVLVYACANGADGQWGGFEALPFFEHQAMFGALARSAFAKNLAALGYGIVKHTELDDFGQPTGETSFELAGVSEATCEQFSTRRKQILAHVAKYGSTKQQAAIATRKQKEEPEFEEVDRLWQQALGRARAADPSMFKSAAALKGLDSDLSVPSDHAILSQLQAKDAVWTRQQLLAQIAREHVGQKDVAELLKEADDFLVRMGPHLVQINPERPQASHHAGQRSGRKFEELRYCAKDWFHGVELQLIANAQRRAHEADQAVASVTLARAIADFEAERGFSLSEEQRRAVEHIVGDAGIVLLTGRAGTGKTTVADVFTRAFQAEGRDVIGVALSWNAATKLGQEAGLDRVYSTAKLLSELDSEKLVLTDRHVVLLDEAGMANTLTVARLHAHIDQAGAKFVLQGDSHQLAPVAAGQAFRLLRDALGDAELIEIRRQRSQEDIATAELFYRHAGKGRGETAREDQVALGADILAAWEARGQIERTDTQAEAIERLLDDYLASPLPHEDKLIMAGTHADTGALNLAMRERLVERGDVGAKGHVVALKQGRRRIERTLAPGDRLRFGKLDEDLGVMNGTTGVVESIRMTTKGSAVLGVRLDGSGRMVKLDTATYGHLDYAYARTVDRAQGATVTQAYFLASAQRVDVHLGLVAATRHRDGFKVYATEADLEVFQERVGSDRLRMNALEEGMMREQKTRTRKKQSRSEVTVLA
jgi:conjugative relaxase-like TrwC/TraI family protein